MIALMVALGALIGAPVRFLTDRAVQSRHETVFPWGTLTVNVVASVALGVLAGAVHVDARVFALLGTGFCGTLSTYSTFSYETLGLTVERARFYAVANVLLSLVAGIAAAAIGLSIGTAL